LYSEKRIETGTDKRLEEYFSGIYNNPTATWAFRWPAKVTSGRKAPRGWRKMNKFNIGTLWVLVFLGLAWHA